MISRPSTLEEFRELAAYWANFYGNLPDENVTAVYFSPDAAMGEIRLIEVQADTFDTAGDRVFSIWFDADPIEGLPIPLAIAIVSPNDLKRLLQKPPDLNLPRGWDLLEHTPIWSRSA